ncbi:PilT-like protein [Beggiatoa sp. PS]|nr:PilT-like protein [Beggiatoa sp. PS]
MEILLDTHILLWHLTDNSRLSEEKSQIIENPQHQKFFSMASLWEIAIKTSIGKLEIQQSLETIVPQEVIILELKLPHLKLVQKLPFYHRDPFDRILIAQAQFEKLSIMTDDSHFKHYDIDLI